METIVSVNGKQRYSLECIYEWIYIEMNEWINGYILRWMDDGWINGYILIWTGE